MILAHYYQAVSFFLLFAGLFIALGSCHLIKKLFGIAVFQTAVLLFYISLALVEGARAPILDEAYHFYVNPLPHVLMLTAIVVGIATLAVGLALVVRVKENYGTAEEDAILAREREEEP